MFDRFSQDFNPNVLGAKLAAFVPNLLASLISFALFYILWRILRRVSGLLSHSKFDATARSFLDAVLKYVLLSIALVSALSQLGVHTASLLASLGVLGLTIGFAAKDALSNVISGIFIFWDRPFVIGDLVEIEGKYGRVASITMRSTRVVTPDGKMLALPNTTVVNSTVASYTNFPHLRLDTAFTVGVTEDLGRIEELLVGMCKGDPKVSASPAPRVMTVALNDYNVGMELQLWIDDEREHVELRSHYRRKLFETLRAANVDMPCETLEIRPLQVVGSSNP